MNVLSIDVGSYSIKYFESILDKKRLQHVAASEVLISEILENHPEISTFEEAGLIGLIQIVQERAKPDSKIICHVPSHFVTTRFLTLPVKSAKKAEMMVPFQLEEDIPFSLNECHVAFKVEVQKSQSLALVGVTKLPEIEPYIEKLKSQNIILQVLTTEPSIFDAYYFLNSVAGPFCVLDLGHESSKGYFFYNSKLFSTHLSSLGGAHINSAIAETYHLSPAEAQEYKHQNAFVLTSSQLTTVDPNQKEFALLMDQVLNTMISDFSRWELGFRVNFGVRVAQVFITGGTSSLKNIAPYLTEKFGIKVSILETFENIQTEKIGMTVAQKSRFTIANMMVISLRAKNRLINILTGRFAQNQTLDLPLHSYAFIGVRVASIALLAVIFLVIESFFLKSDIKVINSKLTEVLKNQTLAIPKRIARQVTQNPKAVLEKLTSIQKSVRQQISTLQSANQIQALSPLVKISAITVGSSAYLAELNVTDNGEITGRFEAGEIKELQYLQDKIQSVDLNNLQATLDEVNLSLTFTATE